MRLFNNLLAFLRRTDANEPQRRIVRPGNRQQLLDKYRQPQRDPRRQQAFKQRLSRYRDQGIPLRLQERARYDIRCRRVGNRDLAA